MYKELYSNAFYKMSKTDRILIGDRMLTMNEILRLASELSIISDSKTKLRIFEKLWK